MMNKKILLVASASLLGWSVSQASITSIPTWSYSGGFYCYATRVYTTRTDQTVELSGHSIKFWSHGPDHPYR